MSKQNKNEPCMFCGDIPCSCAGSKPKTKKKIDRPPIAPDSSTQHDQIDFSEFAPVPEPRFKIRPRKQPAHRRDLSEEAALRALLPILSPQEKKRVEAQLNHPCSTSVDKDLHEWKSRNAW